MRSQTGALFSAKPRRRRSARGTLDRVCWANQDLQAMTQLAVVADRYSEQIADVLLTGEPELLGFESARADVRKSLDLLRQFIHDEVAFVSA